MSPKARQSRKELNFIEPGGPFQLEPGLALFLEKAATRFNRFDPLFLQHSVLELCTLLMSFLKKKKNHLESRGEGRTAVLSSCVHSALSRVEITSTSPCLRIRTSAERSGLALQLYLCSVCSGPTDCRSSTECQAPGHFI